MLFGRFQDVRDAGEALDEPRFSAFKADKFLSQTPPAAAEPAAADGGEKIDSSATAVSTDAWSTREFQSAMEEAAGAATT